MPDGRVTNSLASRYLLEGGERGHPNGERGQQKAAAGLGPWSRSSTAKCFRLDYSSWPRPTEKGSIDPRKYGRVRRRIIYLCPQCTYDHRRASLCQRIALGEVNSRTPPATFSRTYSSVSSVSESNTPDGRVVSSFSWRALGLGLVEQAGERGRR